MDKVPEEPHIRVRPDPEHLGMAPPLPHLQELLAATVALLLSVLAELPEVI